MTRKKVPIRWRVVRPRIVFLKVWADGTKPRNVVVSLDNVESVREEYQMLGYSVG